MARPRIRPWTQGPMLPRRRRDRDAVFVPAADMYRQHMEKVQEMHKQLRLVAEHGSSNTDVTMKSWGSDVTIITAVKNSNTGPNDLLTKYINTLSSSSTTSLPPLRPHPGLGARSHTLAVVQSSDSHTTIKHRSTTKCWLPPHDESEMTYDAGMSEVTNTGSPYKEEISKSRNIAFGTTNAYSSEVSRSGKQGHCGTDQDQGSNEQGQGYQGHRRKGVECESESEQFAMNSETLHKNAPPLPVEENHMDNGQDYNDSVPKTLVSGQPSQETCDHRNQRQQRQRRDSKSQRFERHEESQQPHSQHPPLSRQQTLDRLIHQHHPSVPQSHPLHQHHPSISQAQNDDAMTLDGGMDIFTLCQHLKDQGLGDPEIYVTSHVGKSPREPPPGVRSRTLPKDPSTREKIKGKARLEYELANLRAVAFCEQQAPRVFRTASADYDRDVQLLQEEEREMYKRDMETSPRPRRKTNRQRTMQDQGAQNADAVALDKEGNNYDDDGDEDDDVFDDEDETSSLVASPLTRKELFTRIRGWVDDVHNALSHATKASDKPPSVV